MLVKVVPSIVSPPGCKVKGNSQNRKRMGEMKRSMLRREGIEKRKKEIETKKNKNNKLAEQDRFETSLRPVSRLL